jgi:hypothetical protein
VAVVVVVAMAAVPASVDAAGLGNDNARRQRLEWRAAERRQGENTEVAVAEGLRHVGLRHGRRGGRGELEASGMRHIFDMGKRK